MTNAATKPQTPRATTMCSWCGAVVSNRSSREKKSMSFRATRNAVPQNHARTRIAMIVCVRAGLASSASEKPAAFQPSELSRWGLPDLQQGLPTRGKQCRGSTDGAVHPRVQLDASDLSATVRFRSADSFRNPVTYFGSPFRTASSVAKVTS